MVLSVKQEPPPQEGPAPVGLTTATARTLLPPLDDSSGRAELVARRLGEAIRLGLVLDGERLPSEPRLAEQFGVSPVTLREALAILREQGLVVTRRGRGGGTFVQAPADPGEPLQRFSIQDLRDLGDQRRAISGAAASLAAERALPEEIRRLDEQVRRLQDARTPSERRRADTQFTIEVAAAAQSPRLTLQEARLLAEVGDLLGLAVGTDDHEALVGNRQSLVAAIASHRTDEARSLAERHVAAQTERLIRLRLELADRRPSARHVRAADEILGDIMQEFEQIWAALTDLGAKFAALAAAAGDELQREHVASLRPAILELLEARKGLVTGAGVITAPGLLADAPLWQEWLWTTSRGAREALRVNLDPSAPDFYDYTKKDWYDTPQRTQLPRMAGPFVDYACTNEYAITLSSPIMAGDSMLGVSAADVLVSNLDRLVVPVLAAVERPVALTSIDGRVIASNSPDVVPGQRIDLEAGGVPATATPSPMRSWLLVELDDQPKRS